MKKTGLLIAIVLGLTILSGCGRDSTFYSSGLKSEGAIKTIWNKAMSFGEWSHRLLPAITT